MTTAELLAATGNIWVVETWRNFSKELRGRTIFVRAATSEGAANAAKRITGYAGVPYPWNPARDFAVSRFIRLAESEATT